MKAIGILEVNGFAAAIVGVNEMLTAANVKLVAFERRLGGNLVIAIVEGEVSDVSEAVEAGRSKKGSGIDTAAYAVIPKPHSEVMRMVAIISKKMKDKEVVR